jgi:hypothetical protein
MATRPQQELQQQQQAHGAEGEADRCLAARPWEVTEPRNYTNQRGARCPFGALRDTPTGVDVHREIWAYNQLKFSYFCASHWYRYFSYIVIWMWYAIVANYSLCKFISIHTPPTIFLYMCLVVTLAWTICFIWKWSITRINGLILHVYHSNFFPPLKFSYVYVLIIKRILLHH